MTTEQEGMMTMEGQDVFAGQGTEVGDDDPFAGGDDWSDFDKPQGEAPPIAPATEPEPEPEPAPPVAEVPVVDREGQPVSDPRSELERREDAYQYAMGHGEPVSVELQEAHEEFLRLREDSAWEDAAPAPEAAFETPTVADATPEQVERFEQPETEAQEAVSGDAGGVGDPEPPQEAQEPQNAPEAAETPVEAAEEEDAAPPQEVTDAKGKTTHRRYYVLELTGAGKFEQVSWYENDQGKMVPKGAGAKRQTVALVRGAEDALKVGYAALGSPQDGVKLVAVAALHFQPRNVRPKPVEPARTRLEIS